MVVTTDSFTKWVEAKALANIRDVDVKRPRFAKGIGSMKDQNIEKLTSNWEGPYRVIATAEVGAYYLEDLEERPLPRPWNI